MFLKFTYADGNIVRTELVPGQSFEVRGPTGIDFAVDATGLTSVEVVEGPVYPDEQVSPVSEPLTEEVIEDGIDHNEVVHSAGLGEGSQDPAEGRHGDEAGAGEVVGEGRPAEVGEGGSGVRPEHSGANAGEADAQPGGDRFGA